MKHIFTYISIFMLAMLSACSDYDAEQDGAEGKMTTVSMTIATRAATGTAESPEYDIEKIHSWWIVFVDKNNNVKKIVSRPSTSTDYVEEEKIEFEIPTGTYTLYSFANITQDYLKSKTGLEFTEGSACPDVSSKTIALSNDWSTEDIPMSGKQTVTVTGRANETFSVEVVRMLAKMEFQYSNESSKDIKINSLTMTLTPNSAVSVMPNYTYLDSGWPLETPGAGVTPSSIVRTYSTATLTRYPGSGTAASWTDRFYMMESQANANTSQRYLLTVNITRTGGNAEDQLYALTKELYSIYRNDHIVVPIVLSDYMVGLDVNFYPPIGGYPAVITTNSEKEFYCQFATQGDFMIRPKVKDSSNTYSLVYSDDSHNPYYTYKITTISDPSSIFSITPAIDTVTGEIYGQMNTSEGTAYIDVEITVHRTGSADQLYDRRIYIIRKNA